MRKIPREDLIEDLQRVAAEVGEPVSCTDYNEHGEYSTQPFFARFDSWKEACSEAGVENTGRGYWRYTEDELKEKAQELAERIDFPIPQKPQIMDVKNSQYDGPSIRTMCDRLGKDFLKDVGVLVGDDYRVEQAVKNLKERGGGTYKMDDFMEMIPWSLKRRVLDIVKKIDERDNDVSITWNNSSSGPAGRTFYVSIDGEDRYEKYREPLSEKAKTVFDEARGMTGRSPKSLAGALYYLENDITQRELHKVAGLNQVALRNARDWLFEEYGGNPLASP